VIPVRQIWYTGQLAVVWTQVGMEISKIMLILQSTYDVFALFGVPNGRLWLSLHEANVRGEVRHELELELFGLLRT